MSEFERGIAQIEYLEALVAKVQRATHHPNFMPGIFQTSPPDIPIPQYEAPSRKPLQWGPVRIFAGSVGAAVSIGCFAFVVFMQT
jgi:hypothetical protein